MDLFLKRLTESAVMFFSCLTILCLAVSFAVLISVYEQIYNVVEFFAFWIALPCICLIILAALMKWFQWVFVEPFQEEKE